MKTINLKLPELALVAATRGMLGVGIGMLASPRLGDSRRKTVGRILLGIGVLSTIPLARRIFRK